MSLEACPECGAPWTFAGGVAKTLVGYLSGHDDNCRTRFYRCANGHKRILSKRNTAPDGWVGKASCWCHPDPKVDEWPAVEPGHDDIKSVDGVPVREVGS